jgi:cell division protein FtsZ
MHNDNSQKQTSHLGDEFDQIADIKVIGVGGGGNNTVHSMIEEGIQGVTFIAANTDKQILNASSAEVIMPLGYSTRGLGAGADPEQGRKAALESEEEITKILEGADMVIVAAGMGGGTGTGAAPVIAKIAKDSGALTVGIVTTPFDFEGGTRMKNALQGLEEMRKVTDSLIVVSNNKLLEQYGGISLKDSFLYADMILKQSVRTITDLIAVKALINLDFADLRTIMKNKGQALIGIGQANGGEDMAERAAMEAISSPILEASISGATDAIVNVSGANISLEDANKAVETIKKSANSNINIIFGVSINEKIGDAIYVSVIATGLSKTKEKEKDDLSTTDKNSEALDLDFTQANSSQGDSHTSDNSNKSSIQDDDAGSGYMDSMYDEDEEDDDDLPEFLRR